MSASCNKKSFLEPVRQGPCVVEPLDVLSAVLKTYQQRIEKKIRENISNLAGEGKLREACEYALLNGGRRFRPALVYMVAEALNPDVEVSYAALSIEYFHTASLIADDLPCMDDDDERRNMPSLHKAYGEATALLSSYALIAAGNACIAAAANALSKALPHNAHNSFKIGILALDNAAANTGFKGTTGGQYLDIYPPDLSLSTQREVIVKKTVSLFEVAFVFGWLFGGGDLDKLPSVKKCAHHFGMAFQIADDLGDLSQDAINGRKINIASCLGSEAALTMFHEELNGYRSSLSELRLDSKNLLKIAECLENQTRR